MTIQSRYTGETSLLRRYLCRVFGHARQTWGGALYMDYWAPPAAPIGARMVWTWHCGSCGYSEQFDCAGADLPAGPAQGGTE